MALALLSPPPIIRTSPSFRPVRPLIIDAIFGSWKSMSQSGSMTTRPSLMVHVVQPSPPAFRPAFLCSMPLNTFSPAPLTTMPCWNSPRAYIGIFRSTVLRPRVESRLLPSSEMLTPERLTSISLNPARISSMLLTLPSPMPRYFPSLALPTSFPSDR